MQLRSSLALAVTSVLLAANLAAAASLAPLSTFGTNGFLAPGSGATAATTSGDLQRGIAYNPVTGNLLIPGHSGAANGSANVINIISGTTGASVGQLSTSALGSLSGTFAFNGIGVSSDGTIYVGNLTTQSTTSAFKVYKWTSESSTTPTVTYTGNGGLAGARVGDDLAITGSGSSTLLAVGYNSTPSVAGNNSYGIIDPTAGTATGITFTGTPPNAGEFRLGLTFVDSTHVLGTSGSSLYRSTSYTGSAGTLIASPAIPDPSGATADRLLAYAVVGGVPVLAVQSVGDSHVSVYNVADPSAPVYLASGLATVGTPLANGNASGNLAWGPSAGVGVGATATLYGLSTNAGIQAFTFTLPEPASLSVIIGTGIVALRRRK